MRLPQNKYSLAGFAAMLLWLALGVAVHAQTLVPVPQLTGRIVDQTGTLNAGQTTELDARLRDFEQRKGSQVAVLIVPRTQPEAIEQFSIRVAEQWQLGRKKIDDGAILVIAKDERTLRIEVGYGLEGVLNDATCKRIIDEVIVPRFKAGDFYSGITAGTEAMMKVIDGEALPAPASGTPALIEGSLAQAWPVLLAIAFALSSLARKLLGPLAGGLVVGGLLAAVSWLLLGIAFIAVMAGLAGFMITLLGAGAMLHGMRAGQGGPYRHGGDFGGGGFRGGGGGFGGGGASGRW